MQRYFISADNWISDQQINIDGDDFHHITRVMRMSVGDDVICNHPNGSAAECVIVDVKNDYLVLSVKAWLNQSVELPVHVTIAQGLPKGDKIDLVLQKGTELGAARFILFQASRSVVKWDEKKALKKQDRFNKIVKEASEQSHRNKVPEVEGVSSFQLLLEKSETYNVKLFAYEEEAKSASFTRLSSIFNEITADMSVLVCIGPEGGFSPDEVNLLKAAGFSSVRLGPRILRTETASLYFLSSISYHFEELR
ncbi:16S rRNA (uracil(1498)-N(3))-methyltransferase [Aquibacillus salsiterrae]|uniref:Ribosomal RNA small subunit methyltransferase E n=1 Tax=Aquibacillus salsiterrae TaxID=2950439 RepID=A0A9X4AF13_9BACI|nr:16S rRNA (uracil(1498)-N(3))-methyltransferase [Aquibacillus salsiterrae]MDC3415568.1 16S rRNA (uracil(1498)-N(3))-methyltransferase [Aquibacillus salsiterrae]